MQMSKHLISYASRHKLHKRVGIFRFRPPRAKRRKWDFYSTIILKTVQKSFVNDSAIKICTEIKRKMFVSLTKMHY